MSVDGAGLCRQALSLLIHVFLGQACFARLGICLGSSMADQNSSGTREKLIISLEVNLEPAAGFDIDGVRLPMQF